MTESANEYGLDQEVIDTVTAAFKAGYSFESIEVEIAKASAERGLQSTDLEVVKVTESAKQFYASLKDEKVKKDKDT